jgi:hypothetical protein
MAEPAPSTPEPEPESAADAEEFEVEAHTAMPLGLQELGVKAPEPDQVLGSTSATSLAVCC